MKNLLLLILLSTFTLSGCSQDRGLTAVEKLVRTQYPDVTQISTQELADQLLVDSTIVVLDTRTPEEFAVSHLPRAIQISPDATDFPELANIDSSARIVAYCSVGYRSSEIANRLQEAGFTNVANLEGSIFRWANEGRPLEREGELVRVAHPYNSTWARLLREDLRDYGDQAETSEH